MLIFLEFLIFTPITLFAVFISFFQFIKLLQKPSLSRNWSSLCENLPKIIFSEKSEKEDVFVKNIRNAVYKNNSEFDNEVEFLNKKYKLRNISKIWMMANPWAPFQTHIILSFQFGDNIFDASFLTLSYEVRKLAAVDFYTSQTIFKNFEGFYVAATEEDVFYVRTNIRKDENLYLFPLNIDKEKSQKIFLDFAEEINNYSKKPIFYRIWRRNCLTETFKFFKKEGILNYSYFNLFNIMKLIYKNNFVENFSNKDKTFKEFLEMYKVKVPIKNVHQNKDFSLKIRGF